MESKILQGLNKAQYDAVVNYQNPSLIIAGAGSGKTRVLTSRIAYMLEQGVKPYILSTEACAICERCACLDGQPCRYPEKMHPCVESHGINLIPTLEENGMEFQFGGNVVTWVSLLFY